MPPLDLEFGKFFCERHFQPYFRASKLVRIAAIGMLLDKLMADPKFFDLCNGSMDRIEENLYIVAPVCCYIPASALTDVYMRTGR